MNCYSKTNIRNINQINKYLRLFFNYYSKIIYHMALLKETLLKTSNSPRLYI